MQDIVKQIDEAIHAHNVWKEVWRDRLNATSSEDVDVEEIARDDGCAFGKWLYGGSIPPHIKTTESFERIVTLHQVFHTEAAHVIRLMLEKRVVEARRAMTEEGGLYFRASSNLLAALEKWKAELQSE